MIKKITVTSLFMFLAAQILLAQASQPVSMADQFREDGKIWVVIVVFGTLILGFFVYLFSVDKKISRIEKRIENEQRE